MPDLEVYPKLGETYPDAAGVPITSVGAIVSESKYIEDALRDGHLLTWDPLDIYLPEDRRTRGGTAPATAAYVTLAPDATLTSERVLLPGPGISFSDTGANGTVTISSSATGAVSSVFGRVGAVLAVAGDYTSTLVSNLSTVAGATLTLALDTLNSALSTLSANLAGKGPADAEYLVSATHAGLSAERVLTQGPGITLTPGAGTMTVSAAVTSAAPTDAEYLVSAVHGGLSSERVLTAGANITLTPGPGTLTVASSVAGGAPTDAEYLVSTVHGGLSAERVLTAGTGIALTPAAGTLTVNRAPQLARPSPPGSLVLTPAFVSTESFVMIGGGVVYAYLPNDTTYNWPIGTRFELVPEGQSNPSLTGEAGVTVRFYNSDLGEAIATTGSVLLYVGNRALCVKQSSNTWHVYGSWGRNFAFAPANATYLVTATNTNLSHERVLTQGPGITITDGGAGGAVTLATSGTRPVVLWSAASLTLSAAHNGALIVATGSTNQALFMPDNASAALPVGFSFRLQQDSSNSNHDVNVGVMGAATAKLDRLDGGYNSNSCVLDSNMGWMEMVKVSTDRWIGYGKIF